MPAVEIFTANAIGAGRRCDNEFCSARNPWPIHHIGHRTSFRRLCTSCILRYHRGFFCSVCLEVLESPPLPIGDASTSDVSRCVRCPSTVHSSCVPHGSESSYLCPICEDPEGFSYFPVGENGDLVSRPMDPAEARALLSASRIAAASMSRAAVAKKMEAERKMKQAVVARMLAKEMLEKTLLVSMKRKEVMSGQEGKDIMEKKSTSGKINGVVKVKKKKKKKIKKVNLISQIGLV